MNYVEEFHRLKEDLEVKSSSSVKEAKRLASNWIIEVEQANAEECWKVLWDKPLYSNISVGVANRMRKNLDSIIGKSRSNEAEKPWRILSGLTGAFDIVKNGSWKKEESYLIKGALAEELTSKIERNAKRRLYAIHKAAEYLCKRERRYPSFPLHDLITDFGDTHSDDFNLNTWRRNIKTLRKCFGASGSGWGEATVCHALADMGLAVKPDIHVTRTMHYLATGKKERAERIKKGDQVVGEVKKLQVLLESQCLGSKWWGGPYGENSADESNVMSARRRRRFLDKVLMEISREILKVE